MFWGRLGLGLFSLVNGWICVRRESRSKYGDTLARQLPVEMNGVEERGRCT